MNHSRFSCSLGKQMAVTALDFLFLSLNYRSISILMELILMWWMEGQKDRQSSTCKKLKIFLFSTHSGATAVNPLTHMLFHLCCAVARQHVACGNSWRVVCPRRTRGVPSCLEAFSKPSCPLDSCSLGTPDKGACSIIPFLKPEALTKK